MADKKAPVIDLSKKLKAYRDRDKPTKRNIFEVGVPQCLWTDKNKPYGCIPLYDDTTQNDVLDSYCRHKKERIAYLRSRGIKTRKHITKNVTRDHEWYLMSKCYKGTPDYKQMAKQWAPRNRQMVNSMLLRLLWKNMNECISARLKNVITTAKSKEQSCDTFLKQCHSSFLKKDFKRYVDFYLPRAMRSAVNRYKKT
jgi:hypothetical protein